MRYVLVAALTVGLVLAYLSGASKRAWLERQAALGIEVHAGDVVFQDLRCGERCAAIRAVTRSRYTHVGVVLEEDGELVVWEALGPVGPTPLADWARRGELAVYRPRLDRATYPRFADAVRRYAGRPYDGNYLWDDARIYCSELVAKAWRDAFGEALVEPRPVSLGVWAARAAALTNGALVDDTAMVTPADLVRSGRLTRIVDELE